MDFIRPFPDSIPIGCNYTEIAAVRKVFCLKSKKSILGIFMNIAIQYRINVNFDIGLRLRVGKRISPVEKGEMNYVSIADIFDSKTQPLLLPTGPWYSGVIRRP